MFKHPNFVISLKPAPKLSNYDLQTMKATTIFMKNAYKLIPHAMILIA